MGDEKITALKALKRIKAKDVRVYNTSHESVMAEIEKKYDERLQDIEVIEAELTEAEKNKRALEIIKEKWGSRILNDIQEGFLLGSPYTQLPGKEDCDLLKEILNK